MQQSSPHLSIFTPKYTWQVGNCQFPTCQVTPWLQTYLKMLGRIGCWFLANLCVAFWPISNWPWTKPSYETSFDPNSKSNPSLSPPIPVSSNHSQKLIPQNPTRQGLCVNRFKSPKYISNWDLTPYSMLKLAKSPGSFPPAKSNQYFLLPTPKVDEMPRSPNKTCDILLFAESSEGTCCARSNVHID